MKKGFTIVELISVIVILSIILVLVIPNVSKSIKRSKNKTYLLSISNISKMLYNTTIENSLSEVSYVFNENKVYYEDKVLELNEKLDNSKGIIKVLSNGNTEVLVTNDNTCISGTNNKLDFSDNACNDIDNEILKALTYNVYKIGKDGNYNFTNGRLVELNKEFSHPLLQIATGKIQNNKISIKYNNVCIANNNDIMEVVSLNECS